MLFLKRICRFFVVASAVALGNLPVQIHPAYGAQDILIGGGSVSGVYYQVALQTCKLMNLRKNDTYNCIGRPALGSVFNVNAVLRGLLDFGITQSDVNFAATKGEGPWAGHPSTELRSVFSLYPETVLLMTRKDANIKSVQGLKGKTVNIGNAGSGHRGNAMDILRLYNVDPDTGMSAQSLQQSEASRGLIDNKIDAFFYTVGNPNSAMEGPANAIKVDLINIDSPAIQNLVAQKPYYVMTTIPANTYNGVTHPTQTYAVKATVVTSTALSDQAVYDYVKTVFENLEEFKGLHSAFKILNAKDMLKGLSAPLHNGAIKYYKERGFIID